MVRRSLLQPIAAAGRATAEDGVNHAYAADGALPPNVIEGHGENERRGFEKGISGGVPVCQNLIQALSQGLKFCIG